MWTWHVGKTMVLFVYYASTKGDTLSLEEIDDLVHNTKRIKDSSSNAPMQDAITHLADSIVLSYKDSLVKDSLDGSSMSLSHICFFFDYNP